MHKTDKDQGGIGNNTQPSHLCPFCAFNRTLWLFIILPIAFLPLPTVQIPPLRAALSSPPATWKLAVQDKKRTHTHTRQRQNPGPFVALVMPVARGQSDLTLQGILWPEENCFSQTCHCIATKSFKYFPREFPSESQVHQAWGTSASGETVWTEAAVGAALRTRMAFGGHESWQSCYVAQMSPDFQMLSLKSPTHLHSYHHDGPLGSSPLGYYEEKLHRGDKEGWKNRQIWMDRLFHEQIRSKSSRPVVQWKGVNQGM